MLPPWSRGCIRSHSRNAAPDSPGRPRSLTTRSSFTVSMWPRATIVSVAVTTRAPQAVSAVVSTWRPSGSSSITRIVKPVRSGSDEAMERTEAR